MYRPNRTRGAQGATARALHSGIWGKMAAPFYRGHSPAMPDDTQGGLDLSAGDTEKIIRWLDFAHRTASPFTHKGAQGVTYLCRAVSPPVIIKATARRGLRKFFDWFVLRREHRAYARLCGLRGVPKCHGILHGRFLVLEYIEGVPRHEASLEGAARERFFAELFDLITGMHRRGVAHGDLQNKNNLFVVGGAHPCVLDFGVAVALKAGVADMFSPAHVLNRLLFRFLRRLDFNTWVKLKYAGRLNEISEADKKYYRRTWLEKTARRLKVFFGKARRVKSVPDGGK